MEASEKKEVKRLKKLESKLINLIADTNNDTLMQTFLDWQEQRNICNEKFKEFVDGILKPKCRICGKPFSKIDVKLNESRPNEICAACFTNTA